LNKIDLVRQAPDVDVDAFVLSIRERLAGDLGGAKDGQPMLRGLWATSAAHEPESLIPLKVWLCENLPRQPPLYPVEALSDVPARVAASEITREKLFAVLKEEVPYATTVVNAAWRQKPDGTLILGQDIVVMTAGQRNIVYGRMKSIKAAVEEEIARTVNFGNRVDLRYQVLVDKNWQDKSQYYSDVQGMLLETDSLAMPAKMRPQALREDRRAADAAADAASESRADD